jgi:hypothetical protein
LIAVVEDQQRSLIDENSSIPITIFKVALFECSLYRRELSVSGNGIDLKLPIAMLCPNLPPD